MIPDPKVSIIIPVYNGSNYLREAIDSALGQSYKNIEVIVVNDGSKDNTEEIALSYGTSIRYYRKENGGQSTALNFGIEKMTGEYFSWLSHDDVYCREKVGAQVKKLSESDRKDVIIYSDWEKIDARGAFINAVRIKPIPGSSLRYTFMFDNPLHGCSLLVPATAFKKHGLFDPSIPMTSDVDLWFRMATDHLFIHVPEILVKGRVHGGQVSVKKSRALQKESDRFYRSCITRITEAELRSARPEIPLAKIYREVAVNFSSRGYLSAARQAWSLGRKESPGFTDPVALLPIYARYLKKTVKDFLVFNLLIRKVF